MIITKSLAFLNGWFSRFSENYSIVVFFVITVGLVIFYFLEKNEWKAVLPILKAIFVFLIILCCVFGIVIVIDYFFFEIDN